MRSNKGLLETIVNALSSFCRLNSRCSQNTLEHRSRISALGYESEKLRTVNKRAAAMRTAKVLEAFMGPGAWHADEVKTYAPACYHGLKLFDLKPRPEF